MKVHRFNPKSIKTTERHPGFGSEPILQINSIFFPLTFDQNTNFKKWTENVTPVSTLAKLKTAISPNTHSWS